MINQELLRKKIFILDENIFNKKIRALRRYFKLSYQEYIFDVLPKLKHSGKKDGSYKYELSIDEKFKRVYGNLELLFTVQNDVVILEDILPNEILLKCFMQDLPTYNGIPYYSNKDLFKIKLMEKIDNDRKNKKKN